MSKGSFENRGNFAENFTRPRQTAIALLSFGFMVGSAA